MAGRRAGLAGKRSGLWWEFHRILGALSPRWVVVENVHGLLSSNGGRDMGAVLGSMAELGYGWAYRVLDAQHFGVAQRRRRVFIVGHLGDPTGRRAAAVLFDAASLSGDSPPSREAGADVAACPTLRAGANRTGGDRPPGTDVDTAESLVVSALSASGVGTCGADDNQAQAGHLVANTITAREGKGPDSDVTTTLVAGCDEVTHTLRAEGHDASEDGTGRGTPIIAFTATTALPGPRRLTPTECERLQGFPDGWTAEGYEGWPGGGGFLKKLADSPRYRMLGNAVAVPVAEWIGRRIVQVEREEVNGP